MHLPKSLLPSALLLAVLAPALTAQDAAPPPAPAATTPAPSTPAQPPGRGNRRGGPALQPNPQTDKPYQPAMLVPGGTILTLFPPDSHYLNSAKITIPEEYKGASATSVGSIISIHNPSIEFHAAPAENNTGTCIILAAGGGHNTLNVGSEAMAFVPYFAKFGISTAILRNRLRVDGYNPQTDEVYDAQQAIRLVRSHAKEWNLDTNRIGIVGFSAGAELATPAAVSFGDWDAKNNAPDDPLAGVSSRPDFIGDVYPGPSPFSPGRTPPAIPANTPPAFIACAGADDAQHAEWAVQYFSAMLAARIPNVEMHIYGAGAHPGSPDSEGVRWDGGLSPRRGHPYGTWDVRFMDWLKDLGFLTPSGTETKAAKDIAIRVANPPRMGGRGGGRRAGAPGAPGVPGAQRGPAAPGAAPAPGAAAAGAASAPATP
jgi:endo-1,4-beta-xylanase